MGVFLYSTGRHGPDNEIRFKTIVTRYMGHFLKPTGEMGVGVWGGGGGGGWGGVSDNGTRHWHFLKSTCW